MLNNQNLFLLPVKRAKSNNIKPQLLRDLKAYFSARNVSNRWAGESLDIINIGWFSITHNDLKCPIQYVNFNFIDSKYSYSFQANTLHLLLEKLSKHIPFLTSFKIKNYHEKN